MSYHETDKYGYLTFKGHFEHFMKHGHPSGTSHNIKMLWDFIMLVTVISGFVASAAAAAGVFVSSAEVYFGLTGVDPEATKVMIPFTLVWVTGVLVSFVGCALFRKEKDRDSPLNSLSNILIFAVSMSWIGLLQITGIWLYVTMLNKKLDRERFEDKIKGI